MAQNSRESRGGARETAAIPELRDNQQIQDDNQTSGESVVSGQSSGDNQQPIGVGDSPNQAANREPAEGARETVTGAESGDAGGTSNRPLSEEEGRQQNLPPRGKAKGDSHA